MTSIVLGTDMAVHGQLVEAARCLATPDPDADIWADAAKAEARLVAMRALVHVADISNAGRCVPAANAMSRCVCWAMSRSCCGSQRLCAWRTADAERCCASPLLTPCCVMACPWAAVFCCRAGSCQRPHGQGAELSCARVSVAHRAECPLWTQA
jgi:3'5'-cyclic nucleotide phosphodiesterase